MKQNKTIRQWITEMSINVFIFITVVMFTAFTLYSMKKSKVTEVKIKNDLSLNLKNQLNLFLPSYLLPEQRQGMVLMLKRIKKDESLNNALVFKTENEIPASFSNCKLNQLRPVTCASNDMSATAVIAPLTEGNDHFGYFLKSKKNSSEDSLLNLMEFAGLILLILGIAFIAIYYSITRLISKTLPLAMDNLVIWIESEMHGNKSDKIQLCFKELDDIKVKIAEVIDRYNQSRDQAIIGQVTSGIMHDIKTPLQSIVAAVHLVNEQEPTSPKRMHRLENLYRMCTNNIPLIGDIIETTLDGNRNIQIYKTRGNLRETVEASIQHTKDFSRLRNVIIEVDGPQEIMAHYDSLQLTRVMNNLLKNSIEAASESKVRPPVVRVSLSSLSNQSISLVVEDSGMGFPVPSEKVFRAFGTTKARGTGLGLLITKKIIEAHEGNIMASNSSEFGGAKMEVILFAEGSLQ
ncbi:MAG TPA: HAMP domain-containing sensor histidine kinase [Bacteriovoracaceae bacterium]|nr:HAMP domain-containing sensor histidine kinase [Bacteriovoracaceae bacterium]